VNNQASKADIAAYLVKTKKLLLSGNYDFVPRKKNMQSLAKYGLTIIDAKNEMIGLTVNDYYKGPEKDQDAKQSGDIWVFKKNVDGTVFYVKIKIARTNGKDILKCLSFHEDGIL
jgi:hypothetical protein